MFEKHNSRKDRAEPIAEPDQQQRPVSPVIEPEPEEYEVSEIQIAPGRRMVRAVEIPAQDADVQTTADRVIDDAVAVNDNPVSGAADAVGVFDIAVIEGQILPRAGFSRTR